MWIKIELIVTTIRSTSTLCVPRKNMDYTMLNFFSNAGQVHILSTASRALNLQVVTKVLMESLQRLYKEEVRSKLAK